MTTVGHAPAREDSRIRPFALLFSGLLLLWYNLVSFIKRGNKFQCQTEAVARRNR
jgi:hypothetical protein